MLKRFLVASASAVAVLGAHSAIAAQGVAVQSSGQTLISWADPDGTVHFANAQNGQVRGTFSAWTPIAGLGANNTANGAVSAPAVLAHHDANDTWDAMWQGPSQNLFHYNGSSAPSEVSIGGAPVAACSAPTFAVTPSGTVYAAVAGCTGFYRFIGMTRVFVPTYPLTVYALSGTTWSSVPVPSILLAPGTAPAIFARTQGAHKGEIDIAYQALTSSLMYMSATNPTTAASWSTPFQITATVTSSPSMYVNANDEAAVVAQLPNNVLGIFYAKPNASWLQIPFMPAGSATGAPSIGGGQFALDPKNYPSSTTEIEIIASPESNYGTHLLGVGQFSSSSGTFAFNVEGNPASHSVLGVGIGGITPSTNDFWGSTTDPWESSLTVMSADVDANQLYIGNVQRGSPRLLNSWTSNGGGMFGPAVFENPYCKWPVQLDKYGTGGRSGKVTIIPIYWGFFPSSSEPNWPDYYATLLGSSYYNWVAQEYGLTKQITAVAPQTFGTLAMYLPGGTGCSSTDFQCILDTKLQAAAKAGTLPKPPSGKYDDAEYMIHTDHVVPCAGGYNAHYTWTDSANQTHTIYYAIVSEGACSPEAVEATVSHELIESLTDPQGIDTSANGWFDNNNNVNDCSQIADLCQSEGFYLFSNATQTSWRMDRMWSNVTGSCETTNKTAVTIRVVNKCLEVPNWNVVNGTPVDLWDCNGGTNQTWHLNATGTISPSFAPKKCLEVPAGQTANGAIVELSDCNGGTNQRWTRYVDGTIRGYTGKCLDNPNWQTANGTKFGYWDCNGGTNQSFVLQ